MNAKQNLKVLLYLILLLSLLITPQAIKAADLEVKSDSPLFDSDTLWIPGTLVTKKFTIKNNSSKSKIAQIQAVQTSNSGVMLAGRLLIEIRAGDQVLYGENKSKSLKNLLSDGEISLLSHDPNQEREYTITALFDPESTNYFQRKSIVFDIKIGFLGSESKTVQGISTTGGIGGPSSSPVCPDIKPLTAPGDLRVTTAGENTVSLAWNTVSPVTHYALSFTRLSDNAEYGNTNIGNITNYVITNLASGSDYRIEVMGVNGCAPGDRATISSGTISGTSVTGSPLGPGGQVLGEKITSAEASHAAQVSPMVSGATATCERTMQFWWFPLIIQIVLIGSNLLVNRQGKHVKQGLGFILIVGILSQAFHRWQGCSCGGSSMCLRYGLFNGVILLSALSLLALSHNRPKFILSRH